MKSLRGQFLIASPTLRDPNFLQSVVLMVRHDDDGAMGVILNRPLEVTVAEALGDNVESAASIRAPLHRGGPCDGPMMTLSGQRGTQSDEVLAGVYFTASRDDIESVMAKARQPVRYIVGYAGWASDQLENELAEGSWIVLSATSDDVFTDPAGLWQKLMSRSNLMKFVREEDIPRDPESN